MKFRKAMAATLAAAIFLFCGTGAYAATAETEKDPDYVFYRTKARDTFEGDISVPGKGEITSAEIKEGEVPAFFISGFEGSTVSFDSLYKSGEQTLLVTKDSKEKEITCGFAVYDRVELELDTGSVTLTVKDNKTLKPVSGAEYALYQGSKRIEEGLVSDSAGKITVSKLVPGSYELRPAGAASGYQAVSAGVPFTIGGVELAGGETGIRTSEGKKITAEDNEILIAGEFSPDVELKAVKEEQITSVTVTYENFGAELEQPGKTETKTFAVVKEAETDINSRKAAGEITGPVKIEYNLRTPVGRSTCNFTQYVEAKAQEQPTPAPTPNNNQNQGGNNWQNSTPSPLPTPTPTPVPTAAPAQYGTLSAYAVCKEKPLSGITMELIGRTSTGTGVDKTYLTDEQGMIYIDKVPDGEYTLQVIENEATAIYSIPYDEKVTVGAGADSSVKMEFSLLTRTVSGTVMDMDGEPLSNITVGLYSVADRTAQEDLSGKIKSEEEQEDISGRTYYNAANTSDLAVTDEDGKFSFSSVEIGEYELMPLVTGGYFAPEEAASCSVTNETDPDVELRVESTRTSITYLGKHGGKLVGRTVTLNDAARTTWVTSKDPMVLKGLVPGEYTLTVQNEEGKEEIEDYSFTVPESSEEQVLNIETSATTGETDIPKEPEEKKPEQKPESEKVPAWKWGLIAVISILAAGGIAFFIVWKIRKKKPEKGGMK